MSTCAVYGSGPSVAFQLREGIKVGCCKHTTPVVEVASTGMVTPTDVRRLRREVFRDAVVSCDEADALFFLNQRCHGQACPEWNAFFVEALSDYVVHQAAPAGHVGAANAAWLIERIDHDGRVDIPVELELLISVLERARSCPEQLAAYALDQVRRAAPHVLSAADVELARRILYAFGGDGATAITRSEAAVLFDLNDATIEAENHPSWSDLFVKAIANFLMASSGYQVPPREVALRREAWLDERGNVTSFMSNMLAGGLKGVFRAYMDPGARQDMPERPAPRRAGIDAARAISEDEAKWLADRIGRDGQMHRNEKALLEFIREESPDVHPALRTLIDAAA